MTVRIALLGLGEAGSEIATDLVAAGADVRGYDPKVDAPPGVAARVDEADAVRDADVVLSANSSHDAVPALVSALSGLGAGTIWADLNTAAPQVKERLVEVLAGRDVAVVDVALMSPVPGRGIRTPMLVSGEGADRYAEILGGLGADVTVQPGPPGAAISRKLLRSVFYKGLATAVVEALAAAEAAGCADWLRDNISAELAGFDEHTIDRLVDGTHRQPGAEPTRWPPPPSSCPRSGSRPGSPPPPATRSRRSGTAPTPEPLGAAAGRGAYVRRHHMIIDCHGHYTTAPAAHAAWRSPARRVRGGRGSPALPDDLRRRDPRDGRDQPAAPHGRARHRPDRLLPPRLGDGAPHRGPVRQRPLGAGQQRSDPGWCSCTPSASSVSASSRSPPASRSTARSPSCAAASRSSVSSAATSTPTRAAATGPPLRSPTAAGTRSTRRWSSSTCRR